MFIDRRHLPSSQAPEGRYVYRIKDNQTTQSPRGATCEQLSEDIHIMADTYTQLYIHIIFAVKGRQSLIPKPHKDELHKYITGIIEGKNQTVIQINSMPDHIHILVGITPDIAISDLVRDIKANSSKFINKKEMDCR